MKEWFCWTPNVDPRTIKAGTAGEAASLYAYWYDHDRCEHKIARTNGTLEVCVVEKVVTSFKVNCRAEYKYDAKPVAP